MSVISASVSTHTSVTHLSLFRVFIRNDTFFSFLIENNHAGSYDNTDAFTSKIPQA